MVAFSRPSLSVSLCVGRFITRTVENKAPVVGFALGTLVTPVAFIFAIASMGGGHGDYFAAKVLFPITMLSTVVFGSITPPFILLALAQFLIYGLVIGAGFRPGALNIGIWLPIAIHSAAVALNFIISNPSFS